ncbi:16069_t:CDS:1, partial [Cetraspora pellucida]
SEEDQQTKFRKATEEFENRKCCENETCTQYKKTPPRQDLLQKKMNDIRKIEIPQIVYLPKIDVKS